MENARHWKTREEVQQTQYFRRTRLRVWRESSNDHMGVKIGDVRKETRKSFKAGEEIQKIIYQTSEGRHSIRGRCQSRDEAFLFNRRVHKRGWWGGRER
jgi:hypothetical protein